MRWFIAAILLSTATYAGGTEDCAQRCSDRLGACTNGCKARTCLEKCSSQMEKCIDGCGPDDGSLTSTKQKAPKGTPGKMPKPMK